MAFFVLLVKFFEENVSKLLPEESIGMDMKVLHFDAENLNGTEVDASYEWMYDPEDVKVEGEKGKFTVTRLSTNWSEFSLTISWADGGILVYYEFPELSYNLEDYDIYTDLPEGKYDWIIPEGTALSKADLNPQVTFGNNVLSEEYYDLKVQKYLGYDEETFEDVFEDSDFPLAVNTPAEGEDEVYDVNGNPVRGIGIYCLTATGKNGYEGSTMTYVFVYSDHSLNFDATSLEFDAKYTIVSDFPYIQYEVVKGKTLAPSKITIAEGSKVLTPGTDCEVTYLNTATGDEYEALPAKAGLYRVVVRGINEYYGSNAMDFGDYIKVGAKNPMTVKPKTIKAKKSKKMSFKASKAFTVKKVKGKAVYKKVSGDKKITVSKTGKVTVKKGLKKGKTYKVRVKVSTEGNASYLSASKTVTLKVKVK